MKKLFAIIAICFVTVTAVNAQDYNRAIGIEGGWGGVGLTYKQFTSSSTFLDFKATCWLLDGFGVLASGTYDFNQPLCPGLSFFYGLGVEAGIFTGMSHGVEYHGHLMAGAFGNIGLEYAFSAIPFAVSLEWNPGVRLVVGDSLKAGFAWEGLCLGIKYTF